MKMLKITAAVAFALAMAGCGDSGSKDAAASGAANTSGNAAANVAAKRRTTIAVFFMVSGSMFRKARLYHKTEGA